MRKYQRLARFVAATACGLLAPAGAGQSQAGNGRAPLPTATVLPFTVSAEPQPGAAPRPDQDGLLRLLGREATLQAGRTLTEHGIAGQVTQAPGPVGRAAPVVVTGSIRLPVSLPPGISAFDADKRRGTFATGTATFTRPDGTVIATETIRLGWGAVSWVYGGRPKRIAPLEAVLEDFSRKAADRAVLAAAREMGR